MLQSIRMIKEIRLYYLFPLKYGLYDCNRDLVPWKRDIMISNVTNLYNDSYITVKFFRYAEYNSEFDKVTCLYLQLEYFSIKQILQRYLNKTNLKIMHHILII